MKTIRMFCNALMSVALTSLMIWSCTKVEAGLEQEETRKVYTAPMVFNGTLTAYDAPTRAGASSWEDHSQVFLQFFVGDGFVEGSAVYDASTDMWGVESYEHLTSGQELKCHAYYFENPVQVGGEDIVLNEKTAVYRDTTATYFFDGDTLTLNAHLVPITGRVRFEGEPGATCTLAGVSRYTEYNFSGNSLKSTPKELKFTLPESGKSDYYYLFFDEHNPREMWFYDRDNNAKFIKKCSPGILAHGKSGYMTVPTTDSHDGWGCNELVKTFQIDTVSFKMILVDKGSFNMGEGYYTSVDTVHRVTLTKDYYIAETEVTQALYATVMGDSVDAGYEERPISCSWDGAMEFISELNRLIDGEEFRLPTEAEWEFAAKGGNMSAGYEYAGSFDPLRVAIYNRRSSGATREDVKSREPNEIGLYDMSGNVAEWCYDWCGQYYSGHQLDPTGPIAGTTKVCRGGGYQSTSSDIAITKRHGVERSEVSYYNESYYIKIGFRLASY